MIRQALPSEAETLTRLSFVSKGYWGYPKAFFDIWLSELTISPAYIESNKVSVFEKFGAIIGYYSLIELKDDIVVSGVGIKKGFWLEHMFVEPGNIGRGGGRKMFAHLREVCGTQGIIEVGILSDPNSRGFYEKMGCKYQGEYPSTIKNRTTPYLMLNVKDLIDTRFHGAHVL